MTCMHNWVCQMGLYVVPLFLGFCIVYVTITYGDLMFGVFQDELMGGDSLPWYHFYCRWLLVVSWWVDWTLLSGIFPIFLPTFGRQFGVEAMEHFTFTIPEWIYPAYGLSIMFISELAGLYILEKFYEEEFDGSIALWQYRFIQSAYFALFGVYIYLMSTGWNIPSLNILLLFQ